MRCGLFPALGDSGPAFMLSLFDVRPTIPERAF
jgi:hypothetical protein